MYSENMVLPPASDAMNKDDGKNTYKNYYTLLSSYCLFFRESKFQGDTISLRCNVFCVLPFCSGCVERLGQGGRAGDESSLSLGNSVPVATVEQL